MSATECDENPHIDPENELLSNYDSYLHSGNDETEDNDENITEHEDNNTNEAYLPDKTVILKTNDYDNILKLLQNSKRTKWKEFTTQTLEELLQSSKRMNKEFIHDELNIVIDFFVTKTVRGRSYTKKISDKRS